MTAMMRGRQWWTAELSTLRAVGGEEMQNGTASASDRRAGGFKTRLRHQEAHGAWPARQQVGDECHPRIG